MLPSRLSDPVTESFPVIEETSPTKANKDSFLRLGILLRRLTFGDHRKFHRGPQDSDRPRSLAHSGTSRHQKPNPLYIDF